MQSALALFASMTMHYGQGPPKRPWPSGVPVRHFRVAVQCQADGLSHPQRVCHPSCALHTSTSRTRWRTFQSAAFTSLSFPVSPKPFFSAQGLTLISQICSNIFNDGYVRTYQDVCLIA